MVVVIAATLTGLGPKARCPMTLTATNATDTTLRRRTLNQFIAQSLMIPFPMIMGDTLGDGPFENGARRVESPERGIPL